MSLQFSLARQQLYRLTRSESFCLAEAALYIALEEYPELEVEDYLNQLDEMANVIKADLPEHPYPLKIIQVINHHLFNVLGFKGNQSDYYNPDNSYLNQVLDRRTGIPITLSLIYLELARRIQFPMVGINFPGHFLIRPIHDEASFFVDPFFNGELLFEQDCRDRLRAITGQAVELDPNFFQEITCQSFLVRMLNNLKHIYLKTNDLNRCLAASERLLLIHPTGTSELRDRGILYYQSGRWSESTQDLMDFIHYHPENNGDPLITKLLDRMRSSA